MKQQHPWLFSCGRRDRLDRRFVRRRRRRSTTTPRRKQMMKASFRTQGIATVDRLQQDEADAACSKAQGAPLPEATRTAIEAAT